MEINDALVTAITRELLKRLGSGETLPAAGKKRLVVSGDLSDLGAQAQASLQECYDITGHSGLEADFPEDAEVLVTRLGVQALVRLSEGDAGCTPEGAALLWALLRGKKPVIVEEGIEWRRHKNAMCPSLAAKYGSHERTLALYGAVFAKEAALAAVLGGGACRASPCAAAQCVAAPSPARGSGGKKVISEVEMMRLCPASAGAGQSVEIGARDILTPLAEDYVSKMRITVNRIG